MKRVVWLAALTLVLPPAAAWAQDVTIPKNIERLAERAGNTVNVTVDGALLGLAAKFLSSKDPEQRVAKELISGLKGVYVRSFEFDAPGQYTEADVESLRALMKGPNWQRMVGVRSRRDAENVDVFFKMDHDRVAGIVVIAAQPRQLTFVNIVGTINLEQLALLGGNMGIPKIEIGKE